MPDFCLNLGHRLHQANSWLPSFVIQEHELAIIVGLVITTLQSFFSLKLVVLNMIFLARWILSRFFKCLRNFFDLIYSFLMSMFQD